MNLKEDAIPAAHQQQNQMNPNYAKKVKEDLDKLFRFGLIKPIDQEIRLSPIVVVPKKSRNIWVCVDYRDLYAVGKSSPITICVF